MVSFIVTTSRETGTIAYHCATAHLALEKVRDFQQADYRDITVCTTSHVTVTERALAAMVSAANADQPRH